MKKVMYRALPIIAALSLAGCGSLPNDRALSGAGIGAAGGAVIGALAGGPLLGAVVGGAAGAAIGAVTTPQQVDLGRPVWRQ